MAGAPSAGAGSTPTAVDHTLDLISLPPKVKYFAENLSLNACLSENKTAKIIHAHIGAVFANLMDPDAANPDKCGVLIEKIKLSLYFLLYTFFEFDHINNYENLLSLVNVLDAFSKNNSSPPVFDLLIKQIFDFPPDLFASRYGMDLIEVLLMNDSPEVLDVLVRIVKIIGLDAKFHSGEHQDSSLLEFIIRQHRCCLLVALCCDSKVSIPHYIYSHRARLTIGTGAAIMEAGPSVEQLTKIYQARSYLAYVSFMPEYPEFCMSPLGFALHIRRDDYVLLLCKMAVRVEGIKPLIFTKMWHVELKKRLPVNAFALMVHANIWAYCNITAAMKMTGGEFEEVSVEDLGAYPFDQKYRMPLLDDISEQVTEQCERLKQIESLSAVLRGADVAGIDPIEARGCASDYEEKLKRARSTGVDLARKRDLFDGEVRAYCALGLVLANKNAELNDIEEQCKRLEKKREVLIAESDVKTKESLVICSALNEQLEASEVKNAEEAAEIKLLEQRCETLKAQLSSANQKSTHYAELINNARGLDGKMKMFSVERDHAVKEADECLAFNKSLQDSIEKYEVAISKATTRVSQMEAAHSMQQEAYLSRQYEGGETLRDIECQIKALKSQIEILSQHVQRSIFRAKAYDTVNQWIPELKSFYGELKEAFKEGFLDLVAHGSILDSTLKVDSIADIDAWMLVTPEQYAKCLNLFLLKGKMSYTLAKSDIEYVSHSFRAQKGFNRTQYDIDVNIVPVPKGVSVKDVMIIIESGLDSTHKRIMSVAELLEGEALPVAGAGAGESLVFSVNHLLKEDHKPLVYP